jgi:ubiquinone/menaquinone biosynthesis C-methylase UbiE
MNSKEPLLGTEERCETSQRALANRRRYNENFAQADFDGWVFENLNLKEGLDVLDVGCGDGKHLFKIEELVGQKGRVVGVDISEKSLEECRRKIEKGNLSNVNVLNCDFALLKETLNYQKGFDRILSSFAIYYTKDKEKTLRDCYGLLKKGGIMFFCGPTEKSNREFLDLAAKAESYKKHSEWVGFFENEAKDMLTDIVGNVEGSIFENKIIYPSSGDLLNYWKSTQLYESKLESAMKEVIEEEFSKNRTFTNTKITLGLRCTK